MISIKGSLLQRPPKDRAVPCMFLPEKGNDKKEKLLKNSRDKELGNGGRDGSDGDNEWKAGRI